MTGTERKTFQKYYPPDFDPSKIPKAKGGRNKQFVQRVMAPFNMQCNTCNEYIHKGKKFNMKRETAEGEFYLGLRIFRFYFKCPNCLADISFKTDLENCDYQMEHGAMRMFEAFKLYQVEEKKKKEKEDEDAKDPMKMLEKRTKMSRAEMDAMGKLEELQELNRQHEGVDIDGCLAAASFGFSSSSLSIAEKLKLQEEKDEAELRAMFGHEEDGKIRRRIEDTEEDVETRTQAPIKWKAELKPLPKPNTINSQKRTNQQNILSKMGMVKKAKLKEVKPELKEETQVSGSSNTSPHSPPPILSSPSKTSSILRLADYGSASDEDSE